MGINIVTYSGKTRTAKHDAIVYDAALDRSGILNGCNVTANNNVLTLSPGYGVIKGRVFEVTSENFTVSLPGSGTQYGALIVTLDLGQTEPLTLTTISGGTSSFNLAEDENVNFNNGRYQMVIASYTLTTTAVTNIRKGHCVPADGMGSTNCNDYVKNGRYYFNDLTGYTNFPSGVANGWLDVYEARYPSGKTDSVKQIFHRTGSGDTHHQTYIRTRTGTTWCSWGRVITTIDLPKENGIGTNIFAGNTTNESAIVTVNSKTRRVGLHVSSSKNAGIWDVSNNNWIIRSDNDGTVEIPHTLKVSGFAPTNIEAGVTTGTSSYHVVTRNKYRSVGLNVSDQENAGIYDFANNRWILINGKTGITTFPAGNVAFNYPIKAPSSIVRGSITIAPTKAGTAVYRDVSWSMGGTPTVILNCSSSTPGHVAATATDVSSTGCRIYGVRDDGTASFAVHYLAVYTY